MFSPIPGPFIKTILLSFLVCNSTIAWAQESRFVDSLLNLAAISVADTNKSIVLVRLSDALQNSDPVRSLHFASEALGLSKQLSFNKGINNALRLIGIYYLNTSHVDSALYYFKKALHLARITHDSMRLGASYENVGTTFIYQGQLDSALHYLNFSLQANLRMKEFKDAGTTHLWLGNTYKSLGNIPLALDHYLKSLHFWEQSKDTSLNGYAYANLSSVYRYNQQFQQALFYAQKSVAFNKNPYNERALAASLYRLGLAYIALDDYQNAITSLTEARELFTNLKDVYTAALCDDQLGFCYMTSCDFDAAIIHFENAYRVGTEIKDQSLICTSTGHLGALYRGRGELEISAQMLQVALSIAKNNQDKYVLLDLYKELLLTHNQAKRPDSVEKYFSFYDSLETLLYTEQNSSALAEMQTKFETEKKEKENIALQFQNEKQAKLNLLLSSKHDLALVSLEHEKDLRLLNENLAKQRQDSMQYLDQQRKNQEAIAEQEKILNTIQSDLQKKKIHAKNMTLLGVLGLALLSGIIAYLFYLNRRRKFQQNIKDTEEKALRAQLKPHFVFNALATIQSQVRNNPALAESYLSKFSHFTQEVLINSEKKHIPLSEELNMLTNYIELQSLRLSHPIQHEYRFTTNLDPEDVMVPPAIFQPLIENSVNHNFALKESTGRLTLSFSLDKNMLICHIEDACPGSQKIITIKSEKLHDRKSFGQQIVRERLDLWSKGKGLKGFLNYTPQPEGMLVDIGIPL